MAILRMSNMVVSMHGPMQGSSLSFTAFGQQVKSRAYRPHRATIRHINMCHTFSIQANQWRLTSQAQKNLLYQMLKVGLNQ